MLMFEYFDKVTVFPICEYSSQLSAGTCQPCESGTYSLTLQGPCISRAEQNKLSTPSDIEKLKFITTLTDNSSDTKNESYIIGFSVSSSLFLLILIVGIMVCKRFNLFCFRRVVIV